MKEKQSPRKPETHWYEYVQAFLDYLRRPKTVFDLKDRAKAVLLLTVIIILLQMVVEKLSD